MRLRVGLLCHAGVGGSARIAVGLATALAARGHAADLFARTRPLGVAEFAPGVTFHPLRTGNGHAPPSARLDWNWSPADVETLTGLVEATARARALDVLHFHYALPFARVAREVRRRLGPRSPLVIGTLHGTDVSVHGRSAEAPTLADDLSEADHLTTVSRSHVRLATQTFGLPRPPELIPNFVDVNRFRPTNGRARSDGSRAPRIVHLSNFRPVKDPASLVRVFARVRRRMEAELWLVGDGEGMSTVRAAVRRAGLERHVRFFGLHPAVELILPHADLLLLTSRAESFCLAALEAAACGLPTVAPRIGGLPEVVMHGETGLLYEAGAEAAAAAAVVRILDDSGMRARMRARAIHRASLFSAEGMVPRYERLYTKLLHTRAGRSLARSEER